MTLESCLLCIEHQSNPTLAQPGPGIHLHLHLWKFHQRRRQTFLSERKRGKVRGNVFLFTIFLLCSAALKSIQAREERQMDEGGPCIVNVYSQSELCSDFHIFLLCNAVSFILRMKLVKIRNRRRRVGGKYWLCIIASIVGKDCSAFFTAITSTSASDNSQSFQFKSRSTIKLDLAAIII